MANHSPEHPDGILDKETFKSFFAITEKDDGALTTRRGHERIPDVWYRRPDTYDNMMFGNDMVTIWKAAPESLTVGGNTGTTNSFVGVDLTDLTGGAYNTLDLLDPVKASCFFYQIIQAVIPDFLRTDLTGFVLDAALILLKDTITPLIDPRCVRIGESHPGRYHTS